MPNAAPYLNLIALLGTTTLPDPQGRMPIGRQTSNPRWNTIGEPGGSETVTLTRAQIPKHTHLMDGDTSTVNITSSGTHPHSIQQGGWNGTQNVPQFAGGDLNNYTKNVGGDGAHTHSTTNFDGHTGDGTTDGGAGNLGGLAGNSHDNMPPFFTINYIMKL
jgi:microcystin-dependent protein